LTLVRMFSGLFDSEKRIWLRFERKEIGAGANRLHRDESMRNNLIRLDRRCATLLLGPMENEVY
jgi:hypothetical protein